MNSIMVLKNGELRKVLDSLVAEKVPAILSYSSRDKWHVASVIISGFKQGELIVEVSPRQKPHPVNINVGQSVGLSLKYGYGKLIFNTGVAELEPLLNVIGGGIITLAIPEKIEFIPRRSYFRVSVPEWLNVDILVKLHHKEQNGADASQDKPNKGKLIDISAGGIQIGFDVSQMPAVREGQFVEIQFTPMPYSQPITFSSQIRSILPTASGKNVCIGLQIVGLEASDEGQEILSRIVSVVEQYYQMGQSGAKQRDFQTNGFSSMN